MKKVVLVGRKNIYASQNRIHDDEGLQVLDGIRYGKIREIEDQVDPLTIWHDMKRDFEKDHPDFHADRYSIRFEGGSEIECTDKLAMHTRNLADENFRKLAALFPNAVTETIVDGQVVRAIDKDILQQEISAVVVEGREERYQFTWPDKKKAMLAANAPISAALRPVREDSVDFDTTENLYIEGDNLEVLKLLRETYLGKIRMIYIDPPYNTGHDFVYEDDFSEDTATYMGRSGQFDEYGNQLVQNTDSNGRFHTDWLNMIYPRLRLAKDLLADDGVIFISIDDNEQSNLSKICDEIFGAGNCIGPIIQNKQNAKNDTVNIQKNHEFVLVYRKQCIVDGTRVTPSLVRKSATYREVFEENGRFFYLNDPITTRGEGGTLNARPNLGYTVYYNPLTKEKTAVADYDVSLAKISNDENVVYSTRADLVRAGYVTIRPPRVRGKLGCWTWALEKFNTHQDEIIITGKNNSYAVRKRTFVSSENVVTIDGKLQYEAIVDANSRSIVDFSTNDGTNALTEILGNSGLFNNPKNLEMLMYFLSLIPQKDMLVMDFFSGSASMAEAVLRMNVQDGGNRQFIMVQLPAKIELSTEANIAGYENICEIGKERIRRAGRKIKEEAGLVAQNLDTGFRVLRLDSSNMQDVYYNPAATTQTLLDLTTDNIKPDRTPEDLLFQVMLDLGVLLSSKIVETEIGGKKVFDVADGFLLACFDTDVTTETVTAIAKKQPYYAVFRDSSMANDSVATNFDQIFETYSPSTVRKVL